MVDITHVIPSVQYITVAQDATATLKFTVIPQGPGSIEAQDP